jgi:hypothetical protein
MLAQEKLVFKMSITLKTGVTKPSTGKEAP